MHPPLLTPLLPPGRVPAPATRKRRQHHSRDCHARHQADALVQTAQVCQHCVQNGTRKFRYHHRMMRTHLILFCFVFFFTPFILFSPSKSLSLFLHSLVLSVTGAAKNFTLSKRLTSVIRKGLAHAVASTSAWVITGIIVFVCVCVCVCVCVFRKRICFVSPSFFIIFFNQYIPPSPRRHELWRDEVCG